jgi:hypothetical protein
MNAMTEAKNLNVNVAAGLVASAVLIDLNISVWVGRKTDRKNQQKIVQDAGAKANDAAHVTKKLFVDNPKLEEIMRRSNAARSYIQDKTVPWMGDLRLLPMSSFLKVVEDLQTLRDEFDAAVNDFLTDYDLQISAQAFKLGALFDRSQYPTKEELQGKFAMRWNILPLPEAGDFRVDAENQLKKELMEAYNKAMQDRINDSMRIMWGRLHEALVHLTDRLGYREDGKPQIFRDSMLENCKELVNILKDFNLTNDPQLEMARQQLHALIDNVEPDELRRDEAIREDVRKNAAAILSKFEFGGLE